MIVFWQEITSHLAIQKIKGISQNQAMEHSTHNADVSDNPFLAIDI